MAFYEEPVKKLPVREFDVVIAGGGTAGVVAALASARQGARTALLEAKGYPGGTVVEGGTALHSFFNLWKAFPGVAKRQVVQGIPQQIIDRLLDKGGTSGHVEVQAGYTYDSACTAIDTEIYKLTAFEMLQEAGVSIFVHTLLTGAVMDGSAIRGVIAESRAGREALFARSFVDCTGYGDLSAYAGAAYTEPNDHAVANSIGVAGVSLEKYHEFFEERGALWEYATDTRHGGRGKIVRISGDFGKVSRAFGEEAERIGMHSVTTSIHDNYFMFIKLNYHMPVSPTDRDAAVMAELELRQRQLKAVELLRKFVPGCEGAFITRTSPSLCIRRGRCIACDYDLSNTEILAGRHFKDEIMVYGFHDSAPRMQIKDGGTYGIPYRALLVAGIENLLAAGMLITSEHDAHMSTRNTVACMGQGQAAGTAAALCALRNLATRALPHTLLRETLVRDGVYFEPQAGGAEPAAIG